MTAVNSKLARRCVVRRSDLGVVDVGDIQVQYLRQELIAMFDELTWWKQSVRLCAKKLKVSLLRRMLQAGWGRYHRKLGRNRFLQIYWKIFGAISWNDERKRARRENAERIRTRNYSLNMMIDWMTPPASLLRPNDSEPNSTESEDSEIEEEE